ncbi:MAG: winged helix-turn-helix transcriptional regulator [Clostridia bacterium]|nr:winged helix-turn-helix transcriptional regulator [Clostridia bacterium]
MEGKKRGKPKKIRNDEIDNKILELLENGLNQTQISDRIGLSNATISNRIKRMKERGMVIPKKEENDIYNQILTLLKSGLNQTQIANEIGISICSISYRIKKMKEKGIISKKKRVENDEIDNKILELLENGLKKKEIEAILNISHFTISKRIKIMKEQGKVIPKKSRKIDKIDKKILELLEQGLSQIQIAEKIGRSNGNISYRIKKMKELGIVIPKKEENDIDNQILTLLKSGLNQTQVAKVLGVSHVTICVRIKKMKEKEKVIKTKENYNNNDVQKEIKEETDKDIAQKIVNLMITKKASIEQVISIAKIYQVEAEVKGLLRAFKMKDLKDQER